MKKDYEENNEWKDLVATYSREGKVLDRVEDAEFIELSMRVLSRSSALSFRDCRRKNDFTASLFCICAENEKFRDTFLNNFRYDASYISVTLLQKVRPNFKLNEEFNDYYNFFDSDESLKKIEVSEADKREIKTFQAIWKNSSYDERVNMVKNSDKLLVTDSYMISCTLSSAINDMKLANFSPESIIKNEELIAISRSKGCENLLKSSFPIAQKHVDSIAPENMKKVFGEKLIDEVLKKFAIEHMIGYFKNRKTILIGNPGDFFVAWGGEVDKSLFRNLKKSVSDFAKSKPISDADNNLAIDYLRELCNGGTLEMSPEASNWFMDSLNKKENNPFNPFDKGRTLDVSFDFNNELKPLPYVLPEFLLKHLPDLLVAVYGDIIDTKESKLFDNIVFLKNGEEKDVILKALDSLPLEKAIELHQGLEEKFDMKLSYHPVILAKVLDVTLNGANPVSETTTDNGFAGFKM